MSVNEVALCILDGPSRDEMFSLMRSRRPARKEFVLGLPGSRESDSRTVTFDTRVVGVAVSDPSGNSWLLEAVFGGEEDICTSKPGIYRAQYNSRSCTGEIVPAA